MKEAIKSKIDRMVDYYETLRSEFKWTANDYSIRSAAFAYVLADKELDVEKIKALIKYIKSNTGVFSYHRSVQMLPEAALLLTHFEDGEKAFDKLVSFEEEMKEHGFKNSMYIYIAAYSLLLTSKDELLICPRIIRAMEIFKRMKENHPWLTTSDDYPVAILLSGEEGSIEDLNRKIEDHYDGLHNAGFHRSNGLQYLSHLLTFNPEEADVKIRRCREVYDRLKEHGLKVSSMYYGIIGFLAMLGEDASLALHDVVEAMDYLCNIKRFKMFYKELNLTFISAIINNEYLEARKNSLLETGINVSVQMLIAAQQAAAIAATSAATSSAAASSS